MQCPDAPAGPLYGEGTGSQSWPCSHYTLIPGWRLPCGAGPWGSLLFLPRNVLGESDLPNVLRTGYRYLDKTKLCSQASTNPKAAESVAINTKVHHSMQYKVIYS